MICCLEYGLEEHKEHKMSIYENIMQGLTEAADYQQGKINARKTRLTVKLVDTFNNNDIKRIRQKTGLSQVMLIGSLGISLQTVEAWGNGHNNPEGCNSQDEVRSHFITNRGYIINV